jgi:hypothetical protein
MILNNVNVQGGFTNPLMVASNNLGQGCSSLAADTYTLSVSIYKNNNPNQQINGQMNANTGLTQCRLYVPLYTFSPMAEGNYFSVLDRKKKIIYTDIFQQILPGVQPGQFNFLVSNGLPNIQFVLMVPFISTSSNGNCGNTTLPVVTTEYAAGPPIILQVSGSPPPPSQSIIGGAIYNTLLSPFSTSGGTPDPICINQFQVQIANQSLFDEQLYYDYETFLEQLRCSNQLNGNLLTGMSSGLINESMFSKGMRYYYADCSRQLPSDDGVNKSVQVRGNNISSLTVDIMCFVGFNKFLEIDITNGAVLNKSSG